MGVIAIAKTNYKYLLLSAAIKASEGSQKLTLMDFLKKVTILDAIRWFGQAWSDVPDSAMYGVWNRVLQRQKPTNQPEESSQIVDEIGNEPFPTNFLKNFLHLLQLFYLIVTTLLPLLIFLIRKIKEQNFSLKTVFLYPFLCI